MSDLVDTTCDQPNKKPKLDVEFAQTKETESIHKELKDFSHFKISRILNDVAQNKVVFLQGTFDNLAGDAVVILEKTAFNEKTVGDLLSKSCTLKQELHNDIYGTYQCFPDPTLNAIKGTVIHPATTKHIAKYERQNIYMVEESAKDYKEITFPYINSLPQFSMQWVYNILDHKAESERIVYEDKDLDTGFVMLPDLKWDTKQKEDLYVLAIVHTRNIKSIRDLGPEHLPLLLNLHNAGIKAIENRYNVPAHQLRIYVHYQPSYYHFHVHYTHLRYDAPGTHPEKAHLLSTIISNIQLLPDYYQKATLQYVVRENDQLYNLYKNIGRF